MHTAGTGVECYAGGRYPDRPRALYWEGQRLTVEEVERQWRTPEALFFRVRTGGGLRFTLTYVMATDTWRVEPLPAGQPK